MIGILTFQKTTNYGSMLQAFALFSAVKEMGIPCEIIDYECSKVEKNEMPMLISDCTSCKKILRFLLLNKYRKEKVKKFKDFSRENMKISCVRYNRETIMSANQYYDGYIVGSDIVWGPEITGEDTSYFLDFADEDKLRFSYAASLSDELYKFKDCVGRYLSKFNALSIREYTGVSLIEELSGKKVDNVIDPTLLFSAEFWMKYIKKPKIDEKYILVYFALDPVKVFQKVRELVKRTGYKVVYIQDTLRQPSDFINIREASIEEFLGYIKYAELIVTGSYHGVAFSVNFNKQYVTNNVDYTQRIKCLTEKLRIRDRDINHIYPICEMIDYEEVNRELKKFREESKKWLEEILKNNDASM